MFLEYSNRKGVSHFLISKTTAAGKERYYIVKNAAKYSKAELLTDMPRGFEFYEYPDDGRVVLRKTLTSTILPDEIATVTDVMERHLTAKDFIVDKSANAIDVYLGHLDREEFRDGFRDWEEQFRKVQSYMQVLRFEKAAAFFKAQRFCHISHFYGWITLETSTDLEYLADKYCFHIDKESLLDFWIEGEEDW